MPWASSIAQPFISWSVKEYLICTVWATSIWRRNWFLSIKKNRASLIWARAGALFFLCQGNFISSDFWWQPGRPQILQNYIIAELYYKKARKMKGQPPHPAGMSTGWGAKHWSEWFCPATSYRKTLRRWSGSMLRPPPEWSWWRGSSSDQ